jgi:hypothetical protein
MPCESHRVIQNGQNVFTTFQVYTKHRIYEILRIGLLHLKVQLKFSTSQSDRYLFSSIWGVTEAAALLIRVRSSRALPISGLNMDTLFNPKRSLGLYPGSEGPKGLVRPSQSICLEKFYSETQ